MCRSTREAKNKLNLRELNEQKHTQTHTAENYRKPSARRCTCATSASGYGWSTFSNCESTVKLSRHGTHTAISFERDLQKVYIIVFTKVWQNPRPCKQINRQSANVVRSLSQCTQCDLQRMRRAMSHVPQSGRVRLIGIRIAVKCSQLNQFNWYWDLQQSGSVCTVCPCVCVCVNLKARQQCIGTTANPLE